MHMYESMTLQQGCYLYPQLHSKRIRENGRELCEALQSTVHIVGMSAIIYGLYVEVEIRLEDMSRTEIYKSALHTHFLHQNERDKTISLRLEYTALTVRGK